MYSEEELLPLSALQHLAFCERQWGLIHLEGIWDENRLTAEGSHLHERTHEPETEVRGDLRVARGLRIRSLRVGLTGKADAVEFHLIRENSPQSDSDNVRVGIPLEGVPGLWHPIPVEYKHGKPKAERCDEIQLCAQVLCLEEMLNVDIPSAVLFYGKPRRRYEVACGEDLRHETERLARRLHELTLAGATPPARHEDFCKNCSLVDICLPRATCRRMKVGDYLLNAIAGDESSQEQ